MDSLILFPTFFFFLLIALNGVLAINFNVVNNCGSTMPVGIDPPINGNSGFSLSSGQSQTLSPPNAWSGRVFPNPCSPQTLAEFTLNGGFNLDYYDVSNVDGFNTRLRIKPTNNACTAPECNSDINSQCPSGAGGCSCPSPNRDDANSAYAQLIRSQCPTSYSWSGDNTKVYTCASGSTDYTITFCP